MILNRKNILTALLLLSAFVSIIQLIDRTVRQQTHSATMPLHSLTRQFIGLEKAFAHVPRAGYYTDKNMDLPLAIAQFEQAQYVLAPTVLELNNTSLPMIIFDCTSPAVALGKIKELKFIPVSANNTGIILAVNPQGNKP